MLSSRRHGLFVFATVILALIEAGCGAPSGGRIETLTREGKVGGMTCVLTIKSQKDPELNWAVTDRVVANFSGHQVEVDTKKATLDNKTKDLPKSAKSVTIDFANDTVTIRADGKPLFGPAAR
jgi:hypothetical protein